MTQLEIWLLAFALAVDCFAVSTVSGIAGCAACSKYALRAAVLFGVFLSCLEVLVAFIQAYVFTMLSAVFIGMAHPEEH